MAAALPLSAALRELRHLARVYVASHKRPSIDACRELIGRFTVLAEQADALEARAREADDMEAVARDLDMVAYARQGEIGGPRLQAVVASEQRLIQAQLDAQDVGAGASVSRRAGLDVLSQEIPHTNVVTFPIVPRPAFCDGRRNDCQGDDGDVA